jgi:predicted deacylase
MGWWVQGADIASSPHLAAAAPPEVVWEVNRTINPAAIAGIVFGCVILVIGISLIAYSRVKARERHARFRQREDYIYKQAVQQAQQAQARRAAPQVDRWADLDEDDPRQPLTGPGRDARDEPATERPGSGRQPRRDDHGIVSVHGYQYGQC